MSPDTHSPDRRPLVYGGVALLILLAAAFLFWPHGADDPTPTRMVLTPESVREDNPRRRTRPRALSPPRRNPCRWMGSEVR